MNKSVKTISFYTLGCRLNQAETALIEESFVQKGYRVVPFGEKADLCVINSCTVTENGDQDCRKTVRRFKRTNPAGKVAVIGCYSQVAAEAVSQIPGVNLVVGNRQKMMLASLLESIHLESDQPVIIREQLGKKESFTIAVSNARQRTVRANLKIQDGCDFFCSFCIIPFARGRAVSREFDDLLREARDLVANGHRELILTGINIGTYHYQGKNFLDIISALEQLEGLDRIRISSIEPTTIGEDFLNYMKHSKKLCHYLHLPLQSGSDRVLKMMNRKYTTAEYAEYLYRALEVIPDLLVGTDIIVGFPGETDEMFEETYRFVESLPLAYFHVFSYSDRSLARSSRMENKVPENIIRDRSSRMRQLGLQKKREHYSRYVGQVIPVLFEQEKNGYWLGHDEHYLLVAVQSTEPLKNQIRRVYIESLENDRLKGILV